MSRSAEHGASEPREARNIVRKNFEFSPQVVALIDQLRSICGVRSEREIVEEALALLGWAVTEARKGNAIGSFDERESRLREITSPALTKARHWAPTADAPAAKTAQARG
jgi:hypothetical protein